MYGATSTGNVENRSILMESMERTSTDTIQGQAQDGRSVQRQTSVQIPFTFQLPGCTRHATAAQHQVASRQVTGSDVTESARPQQWQCAQEPDLPELRYSAARNFFKQIEEIISARKPGASEAGKPHNPETTDEDASGSSCAFDRAIAESFKEAGIAQDASGKKNTLPLCRVVARKTTESVGGLIEELKNARESGSSETGIQCQPGQTEKLASAIHESLERLEKNEEIWAQHNALPLCQAIVKEILALARDYYCDKNAYGFIEAVIGPVYGLALNGALAELKQQWSASRGNDWQIVLLLADLTQHLDFHSRRDDLLLSNAAMLDDLFCKLGPQLDEAFPFHPSPHLEMPLFRIRYATRNLHVEAVNLKRGTANLLCRPSVNTFIESLEWHVGQVLCHKDSLECGMCAITKRAAPNSRRCKNAGPSKP